MGVTPTPRSGLVPLRLSQRESVDTSNSDMLLQPLLRSAAGETGELRVGEGDRRERATDPW